MYKLTFNAKFEYDADLRIVKMLDEALLTIRIVDNAFDLDRLLHFLCFDFISVEKINV